MTGLHVIFFCNPLLDFADCWLHPFVSAPWVRFEQGLSITFSLGASPSLRIKQLECYPSDVSQRAQAIQALTVGHCVSRDHVRDAPVCIFARPHSRNSRPQNNPQGMDSDRATRPGGPQSPSSSHPSESPRVRAVPRTPSQGSHPPLSFTRLATDRVGPSGSASWGRW
jgi:hypothetical protein